MAISTDIGITNEKSTRGSSSVLPGRAMSYNIIRRGTPFLRPVHPTSAKIRNFPEKQVINKLNEQGYREIWQ